MAVHIFNVMQSEEGIRRYGFGDAKTELIVMRNRTYLEKMSKDLRDELRDLHKELLFYLQHKITIDGINLFSTVILLLFNGSESLVLKLTARIHFTIN